MTTTNTKETQQLSYNASYNDGYNAGFYANNKVAPTTRISYQDVMQELDKPNTWNRRTQSVGYIFCIIVIALVAIAVTLGFIAITVQSLIAIGISTYTLVAPIALAVVIGVYLRHRVIK